MHPIQNLIGGELAEALLIQVVQFTIHMLYVMCILVVVDH